jgi:hypothetical protein
MKLESVPVPNPNPNLFPERAFQGRPARNPRVHPAVNSTAISLSDLALDLSAISSNNNSQNLRMQCFFALSYLF